jgi:hypothetical protein
MMYIRFPLSLRQVEDLLNERGIDICHETVRAWWNRFGRHCQTNLNRPAKGASPRLSGRQLTPLGQGGGTVLSEDVAVIEVTVLIEMIMDRGVDGGKLLQSLYIPKLRHCTLSSSERLM